MWEFHDQKMKELKKIYQKMSLQTQNNLQTLLDSFNFTSNNLCNIADYKTKRRINTYIEEWKEKGLLKGYFGILAKNIYNRSRVENSEILELLIYSAYIEEQIKLEEKEKAIFKEDVNYYYQQGIEEVNKTLPKSKQKIVSIIPDAIFLALLDRPNYSGFNFEQYIDILIRYNAEQIYKQVVYILQQQKEVDIFCNEFQNIFKKQNNQKLNINGDKISGAIDMQLIGMNNQAKVEGIKSINDDAKVVFLAEIDGKETPMCHSLHRQEFYINKENEFNRYYGETQSELSIQKIKCKGLVIGLNLPPITHYFHWCRSIVQYIPPVLEKEEKSWYNKLGNTNQKGLGGSGKGTFIEKIKPEEIPDKLRQYEEDIRNMPIEYGILIDEDGNVYAYIGTETNLDITDRKLDNVILTHNHPEIGSFGKDDYVLLYDNPNIKELRAVDEEYTYSLRLKKPLDMSYTDVYNQSGDIMIETMDENQHCVMLKLEELGYIEYDRTRKK